ncbi:geranylgeranylglyceryl/heptaprenylglyceryl phosphate synthase [Vulcanisaeta souniana]|uniref:Geranylgeranylglyceryl phosphate synthase n=1 Tax=Vulcanisaeta souniana JCM 11219 TaxID=1293586 RepID=A0A830E688_9CREN|nr:geranylgeranylglyceryl/heptaprenylglyceryl phosphate synthase [Vulcanisaeta souniana]BDR92192.1 geranylgeranylglyceryl/heptaprenylglyceryl phosphate synthase [Vulcanisaeta souniana JCM 11219]GGI67230.1 geranylgeranylglyceryl/heptaprenylglyceryl phosphate synthase [Vulcanisaeta souniana JCM 11219]
MGIKNYLVNRIAELGSIHMTLLDPDKVSANEFRELALMVQEYGSDALMVGGSLGISEGQLDEYLSAVKDLLKIPVILFPGSVANLSKYADAVFFLSVLNSADPYFIVGAQIQASVLLVKKFRNLEPISLAYIIVGDGGAVGYVSHARPIPYDRDDIALAYAYAAQLMGFDMIYLEAGSGARESVRPRMVSRIKQLVSKPLIVGGGIKDPERAAELALAGADAVVTGTIIEEKPELIKDIIRAVHEGGSSRRSLKRNQEP